MLTLILLALGLYFIQTLLPPAFDYVLAGKFVQGLGARDTAPPATLRGARARRALVNMTEGMIIFLPLAILSLILPHSSGVSFWGALIFVIARILYLPLYLMGVPALRSAIWGLGLGGLILLASGLIPAI